MMGDGKGAANGVMWEWKRMRERRGHGGELRKKRRLRERRKLGYGMI